MYILALWMVFAMSIIGVSGMELGMTYAHNQAQIKVEKIADQNVPNVENALINAIAAYKASNPNALIPSGTAGLSSTTQVSACNDGASHCPYSYNYIISKTGLSNGGESTGNDPSTNINSTSSEQRVAFLVTINIYDASKNIILGTRVRTMTFRVYDFAPYATLVSSTAASGFYTGTQGSTNTGTTEADVSGCDGTTVTSTCTSGVDDTRIKSYDLCYTGNTTNPVYSQWCQDATRLNGTVVTTPPPGTQVNGAINTSTYSNGNSTNGSAGTSSGWSQ